MFKGRWVVTCSANQGVLTKPAACGAIILVGVVRARSEARAEGLSDWLLCLGWVMQNHLYAESGS